jgi:hypothetical protein
MKIVGEDAAFSRPSSKEVITGLPSQKGLTKREYFAAVAMQGLLAGSHSNVITRSVIYADLLIVELNKEKTS